VYTSPSSLAGAQRRRSVPHTVFDDLSSERHDDGDRQQIETPLLHLFDVAARSILGTARSTKACFKAAISEPRHVEETWGESYMIGDVSHRITADIDDAHDVVTRCLSLRLSPSLASITRILPKHALTEPKCLQTPSIPPSTFPMSTSGLLCSRGRTDHTPTTRVRS